MERLPRCTRWSPARPLYLAVFWRGATSALVVVQRPGEILRFDPETDRPAQAIRVGDQPHWMSPYDEGHAVVVTNEGSNTASLIDLATGTVRSVAVGQAPRKVLTTSAAPNARSDAATIDTVVSSWRNAGRVGARLVHATAPVASRFGV